MTKESKHISTLNSQLSTLNFDRIESLALQAGFDACGISKAELLINEKEHLDDWLSNDYHGEMGYMERNIEKRIDPSVLVPNAKTIISVLLNYYPGNPDISTIPPKISRYALSRDYHEVIKGKLYQLLELIRKDFGKVEGRAFIDSAPILEKSWAANAGLGWIGKNSLLLNTKLGSYFFIGELVIDLEVEYSPIKYKNHCGTCTRCIDACPNNAIVSSGVIDSRKCISYLTIEKKTPLTENEKNSLSGWCFGCDICQEVCPWNSKISISKCDGLIPKDEVLRLNSANLADITKETFESIFNNTPVSRAGWEKITPNLKKS